MKVNHFDWEGLRLLCKSKRESHNLSCAQMAMVAGCSRHMYKNFEDGINTFGGEPLIRTCEFLGINPKRFLDWQIDWQKVKDYSTDTPTASTEESE